VWRERRHEPPNLKNLKFSEVFYGGLDACRLRSIRGHRVRALSAFCRIAASCSPTAGPVKLGGPRLSYFNGADRRARSSDFQRRADGARRTLYNRFASKEEIFREMLIRVSAQLEDAFPPGIETQGDVEDVLRLVARMILELHRHPAYLGFLRMVVADSREFPWIAEEFAAVMEPQTERLVRYLAHLTAMGILDCRNPMLAAHQLMGMLNELSLWPWMTGRESIAIPTEEVIEETIQMFLQHYRRPRSKRRTG